MSHANTAKDNINIITFVDINYDTDLNKMFFFGIKLKITYDLCYGNIKFIVRNLNFLLFSKPADVFLD